MEQAIIDYLKAMNIPVSAAYCKKLIRSHPEEPSLLSIADMLQQLGIRYRATRMEQQQSGGRPRFLSMATGSHSLYDSRFNVPDSGPAIVSIQ